MGGGGLISGGLIIGRIFTSEILGGGLISGGLIIGRIFTSEIWGGELISGGLVFFLGGGGLLSEFYGICYYSGKPWSHTPQ